MSYDYWTECIKEAFDDAEIVATEQQIQTVASWAEGAHENYGLATGRDVADSNLIGSRDSEIKELRKKLCEEENRVRCEECKGKGYYMSYGGTFQSQHTCHKCNGKGRA